MKSYLSKNQPIFFNIIKNEFTSHKIPHAFLLVGDNTEKPLEFIATSLICDDTLACGVCNDCRKVKENKYGDIIRLNGRGASIKKGDIEYIQDTFKKSSLEGKSKIYIIENIENATKEAMNTLLKTLEEPIDGVYAIFTTTNINRVLPTIISRCQVLDIKPDSKEILKERLLDDGIDLQSAKILSHISNGYIEAKDNFNERFEYMQLQVVNFIEDLYLNRINLVINVQTNLLKKYKERDDIKLFLNMLLLAMKDMFHVKHNQQLTYSNQEELFNRIDIDENTVIRQTEIVLETRYLLETNANIPLLLDSMMYRL